MKKRDISGFAIVALIIVLLAIVVNHCPAQTDSTIESRTIWSFGNYELTTEQAETLLGIDSSVRVASVVTVEHRRNKEGDLKWNNYKFFEKQPKVKFKNWSSYPDSWDGKQFVIWSTLALSGTADGMLQAYHANPLCFQQNWRGIKEISFFGKRQDLLGYNNGDPEQGHKSEVVGNVGRDFWHTWSFGFQMSLGIGSFAHGARHQPLKYRVANFALGMAVHSLFANFAYHSLR